MTEAVIERAAQLGVSEAPAIPLADFLRTVLPSAGPYALARKVAGGMEHRGCETVQEVARVGAEWAAAGPDVYFATASFTAPVGRRSGRTQDNVRGKRSFYLDVDVGDSKPFRDVREAIKAVRTAVDRGLLPAPSFYVFSGRGLHLWWVLDHDVDPTQWKRVARTLHAAAVAADIHPDAAVTTDTARLMRVPGSVNSESGQTAAVVRATGLVYTLTEFAAALPAQTPGDRATAAHDRSSINDDVLRKVYPLASLPAVLAGCRAMAEAVSKNGGTEPLWRGMLGVIKFTVEGDEAAHLYSQGHPDYSERETQAKLDRWKAGPTTCATFGAELPDACAACEYRGKVKSPIVLGALTVAEQSEGIAGDPAPLTDDEGTDDPAGPLAAHVAAWSTETPPLRQDRFAAGRGGEGLFPLECVSTLAAPGGFLKTALSVAVAMHVGAGAAWAGLPVTPGAAMIVSLEEGAEDMGRRVGATAVTQFPAELHETLRRRVLVLDLAGKNGQFTQSLPGRQVASSDLPARLIAQARVHAAQAGVPVRLIVIDHARLAMAGDVNESEAATVLVRVLTHVARETGAAVVLLAHSPKSSLNAQREADSYSAADVLGSGAFVDNARFAAVMFPLTDAERKRFGLDPEAAKRYTAFRVIKSNFSAAGRVVYLRKVPVDEWGVAVAVPVDLRPPQPATVDGELRALDARVLEYLRPRPGEFTADRLSKNCGGTDGPFSVSKGAVRNSVDRLLTAGRLELREATADDRARAGLSARTSRVLHVAPRGAPDAS